MENDTNTHNMKRLTMSPLEAAPTDGAKEKALITPTELYNRLDGVVGKRSIYEAIKGNRIRHLKLGRKILILASEVEAWPQREAEREGR